MHVDNAVSNTDAAQVRPTRKYLHFGEVTAAVEKQYCNTSQLCWSYAVVLQVVDLEVAADHRGSILGDHPTRLQPPQKMFESKLLHQMRTFSVHRPVFIESESSLVGRRQVPNAMWKVRTTCCPERPQA